MEITYSDRSTGNNVLSAPRQVLDVLPDLLRISTTSNNNQVKLPKKDILLKNRWITNTIAVQYKTETTYIYTFTKQDFKLTTLVFGFLISIGLVFLLLTGDRAVASSELYLLILICYPSFHALAIFKQKKLLRALREHGYHFST